MPNFKELKYNVENQLEQFEFNNQMITVQTYLPFQDKLSLITDIINASGDDQGFYNSAKLQFYIDLKIAQYYTDLIIDDDENLTDVYDFLTMTHFFKDMYDDIPETEVSFITRHVNQIINNIYTYRNSVYGILDSLKTDYNDLGLDIDKLRETLATDEGIQSLKEIVDKMV